MPCSSYDLSSNVCYDASPERLASLPLPRRHLAHLAQLAHRLVAGLEPASSGWRPSQRLLDVLDCALPGGQPGPSLFRLGEPDHPGWGDQIGQVKDAFEDMSAGDRELVIEFTRMLHELGGKYRLRGLERVPDQ